MDKNVGKTDDMPESPRCGDGSCVCHANDVVSSDYAGYRKFVDGYQEAMDSLGAITEDEAASISDELTALFGDAHEDTGSAETPR